MLKTMFQIQYVEGTPIRAHLDKINKLVIYLKNIGEILADKKQCLMSLTSLVDS